MRELFKTPQFWVLAIWLYGIVAWIGNLIKLIECDFTGPWKEEIIHGIGVIIAPVSMVTCWL